MKENMVNFASSSKYRKEREKNGVMHLTLSTGRKEKMYTMCLSTEIKETKICNASECNTELKRPR